MVSSSSSFEKANLITMAIPFFFLAIFIELALSVLLHRRRRQRTSSSSSSSSAAHSTPSLYRANDALDSLAAGVWQVIVQSFCAWMGTVPYTWIYETYGAYAFAEDSAAAWWIGFLGIDFLYYWFHRLSHEWNVFWSAHVVHHSSEEYNLTTALRQSALQPFFGWAFYMPLAFLLPPSLYAFHSQFNTLYQFWIHTRLIGRMGPLEYFLNTPSHHRVHHGRNRQYLDKNYAGTLIVWDMMFGTFEPEGEEVAYGITTAKTNWDPIDAQTYYWRYMWKLIRASQSWRDKLLVIFRTPAWLPPGMKHGRFPPLSRPKYDSNLPGPLTLYTVLQFAVCIVVTDRMLNAGSINLYLHLLTAALVLASFSVFGALFDRRRFALAAETVRVVAVGAFLFVSQSPHVRSFADAVRMGVLRNVAVDYAHWSGVQWFVLYGVFFSLLFLWHSRSEFAALHAAKVAAAAEAAAAAASAAAAAAAAKANGPAPAAPTGGDASSTPSAKPPTPRVRSRSASSARKRASAA